MESKQGEASKEVEEMKIYEIEGTLLKKNPSLRGGYNKRFVKLFEGRYLCYFDPDNLSKPKGTIDLSKANGVGDSKPDEFEVQMAKREFVFKPDTDQERQKWVKTLKAAITEVKVAILRGTGARRSASSLAEAVGKDEVNFGNEDYFLSEHGLTVKGIQKALKLEIPERTRSRAMYGFMDKKRESTLSVAKIYQKRWFFLVSSRPLNKISYLKDDYEMPVMYIPNDMELNTIYYYTLKDDKDDTKPKGSIPCKDIHKWEKVVESSTSYIIRVNLGERIFVLRTASQGECDRWIEAIQLASTTARELAKSRTNKSRNISKLVELYKQGKSSLQRALEEKCELWLPKEKEWKGPEELIEACRKIKNELIVLVDSFRCKEDLAPEVLEGIEKLLLSTLHDRVMKEVNNFWVAAGKNLSSISMLVFIDFWNEYSESLKVVDIEDENLKAGCDRCATAFANNINVTAGTMVNNIIKRDLIDKGDIVKEKDKYYTNAAGDIFKLLGPVFEQVYIRRIDMLTRRTLESTREILKYYARKVSEILADPTSILPRDHLIAILNEEDQFFDSMQKFLNSSIEQMTQPESKKAAMNEFKLKETLGLFKNIRGMVETRLVNEVLVTLKQLDGSYMIMNFEAVLEDAGERGKEIAQHIALDTNFWVAFQHGLVRKYLLCFFADLTKRGVKLSQVAERPAKDKELYIQRFNNNDSEVFDDLEGLIAGNFANLPSTCARLRERFDKVVNLKNIAALIKLREDVDPKEKEETLRYCQEKVVSPDDQVDDEASQESSSEDSGYESEEKKNINEEDKDDDDEDVPFDMEEFKKRGGVGGGDPKVESEQFNIKVHLEREISGYVTYKGNKRYFAVLGGKIYCYRVKGDTLADSSFPTVLLKDVKKVGAKNDVVTLSFGNDQPPLEFQTLPNDDSEKWVDCIRNNINESQSVSPKRRIEARRSQLVIAGKVELKEAPSPFSIEQPRKGKRKHRTKKSRNGPPQVRYVEPVPNNPKPGWCSFWCRCFSLCRKKKPIPTGDYLKINS